MRHRYPNTCGGGRLWHSTRIHITARIAQTFEVNTVSRVRTLFLKIFVATAVVGFYLSTPAPAYAQTLAPQERLCDPSWQNCRTDLLTYIKQETVGIDAG